MSRPGALASDNRPLTRRAAGRRRGTRCCWPAILLLVGCHSAAAGEPWTALPPPQSALAPSRPAEPLVPPHQRIPLQQYRSDLDGQRFRLERYGNPNDLSQQRDLQGLRQEIGRTDRLLAR